MTSDYAAKEKTLAILQRYMGNAADHFAQWAKKTDDTALQRCEFLLHELREKKKEHEQLINEMLLLIDPTDPTEAKKQEDKLYKDLDSISYGVLDLSGRISAFLRRHGARTSIAGSVSGSEATASQASAPVADVRLPKIQIPMFDGDPRKFLKFKSLFSNLIHEDTTIPNVRKLYYLQQALEGPAEEFVRDVDMTENAYNTAWAELLNRYENQRVIIRTHLSDIFEIKKIKDESGIRALLDNVRSSLRGLKGCGENPDQWSTILSYLVSSKLDDATKRDFENSIEDKKVYPSFKTLTDFLEVRASAADERKGLVIREKPKSYPPTKPLASKGKVEESKRSFSTNSSTKCWACSSSHLLIECSVFLRKTPNERYELVKKNGLCANCFGKGHKTFDCRRSLCKTCSQKHHTLLHFDKTKKEEKQEKPPNPDLSKENEVSKTSSAASIGGTVLLPTAVVRFQNRSRAGLVRILSDPASEVTMISESFVRKHRLRTHKSEILYAVEGVGENPVRCNKLCSIILKSRMSDFKMEVECLVVPSSAIKYIKPTESVQALQSIVPNVEFAEANLPYNSTDIIIGAEYVEDYLLNETIKVDRVTLRKSHFGWFAVGKAGESDPFALSRPRVSHASTLVNIERCMKKICDDEQLEIEHPLTEEQRKCLEHFDATFYRNVEGCFVIFYPKKGDPKLLSGTRVFAERSVDKILSKEPELINEYHKFISEYEGLEHLLFVECSEDEADPNHLPYYLPQLLVVRMDKSTTKVRVVFHASFKGRSGKSLNDILMVGPVLQLNLFDIVLRFRRHKVAFTADVEKMYRQILVDPSDRQLQKIVYKKSVDDRPKVGILNTLTYGTAPASFIATKCLFILADSITKSEPQCADIIRKDFYMDDLLTGADSVPEAVRINQGVRETLLSAKFPLRKYISNSSEFIAALDPKLVESINYKTSVELGEAKVLGLKWIPESDQLGVSYKPEPIPEIITKRRFLSEIASVFDVLGVLSPVTIKSKLLMQRIWKEKNVDWDDVIPPMLGNEFRAYLSDLEKLNSFTIDRYYSAFLSDVPFELVGFCDASNRAYCAVVYIRVPTGEDNFAVSFTCAKTKVAPLKELSIPRLELQAAQLLAKLLTKVESIFSDSSVKKYAFSDSKTVLCWLKKPPDTWKVFVANRIRDIQTTLPTCSWSYIRTDQNPADLGTRGISADNLLKSQLWTKGPELIHRAFFESEPESILEDEVVLVEKKISSAVCVTPSVNLYFIDNSSSFPRLIGAIAYVLRIVTNNRPEHLELTADERASSLISIIRTVQRFYYPQEIQDLKLEAEVQKRSPILSLSPFLHSDGIIRVGGRLRNANLSFERKHPIILPAKSRLVELYVQFLHEHYFHATKAFILNFVNSNYWIVGNLKSIVKKVVHRCVACRRYKGKLIDQIMGQLPSCRITVSDAFTNVGIDFAGPLDCKCINHRTTKNTKVYVAIFVCMLSRAVHIEVVSDLTTASFLDTLKRFVSRRGLPKLIMSDNGRTFVGAKNYLDLTDRSLSEWASSEGITWRFIPPRAPHQGGLWEAAVKSAKSHLNRVLKGKVLSFEQYTTIFAQIEAILNSRPLNYRRDTDKSVISITPAHLAIGRPILFVEENPTAVHSLGAKANAIRDVINSFWTIWRNNYLSQLQFKSKWKLGNRNVSTGDVVLLKEADTPPASWPMGVVVETFPDREGIVRTVDVRVSGKVYRRATGKLVLLLESD